MSDLDVFDNEQGPAVWVGRIAEDADDANSDIHVIIDDYDAEQQFGPCQFVPQPRSDGAGVLLPNRGDWCLVSFDQDDNAQLVAWKTKDPTV